MENRWQNKRGVSGKKRGVPERGMWEQEGSTRESEWYKRGQYKRGVNGKKRTVQDRSE